MISCDKGKISIEGSQVQICVDVLVILKTIIDNEDLYKDLTSIEITDNEKDRNEVRAHAKLIKLLKELKEINF